MTRVAIIADSHWDEHSRFEECIAIHNWIATDMQCRNVDLVLHAGDVFERRSTPRERAAFASWVQKVATHVGPLVIVRGNHDPLGDLPIFSRLETRYEVIVEEAANVHVITCNGVDVAVACLAWPRKAELLARLPNTVGREDSEQAAREALRMVLRWLGDELERHEGPTVLLSHAMVSGSLTSTGQPLVGCDLEIGLDDLALAGADFTALGHIHMPQDWQIPTGRAVAYPGSPRRTAYGEVEDKGYIIIDIDDDGTVSWQRVQTPARKMVLIHVGLTEDFRAIDHQVREAEVRLRYDTAADTREAMRSNARGWAGALVAEGGAVEVKIEEVVQPSVRARAPEIAAAKTIGEKLRAVWDARGDAPEEDRAERLIGMANRLEEEVRNVS